ncbi:hypothetical protein C8R46DRAFT_1219035 [Mycena filopes]|nr:hypothetical protein C8R46DRAFT_1219035 [Mycena filopes]
MRLRYGRTQRASDLSSTLVSAGVSPTQIDSNSAAVPPSPSAPVRRIARLSECGVEWVDKRGLPLAAEPSFSGGGMLRGLLMHRDFIGPLPRELRNVEQSDVHSGATRTQSWPYGSVPLRADTIPKALFETAPPTEFYRFT